MIEYTHWGLPIIGYFFLAGLGAGAYTVSGSVLLRGGASGGRHFKMARYGALLAPLPVIIGTGMLVLELGSFEVGNYFKFIYLFLTINLSPMSIGSWLLTVFMGASLLYAYTFWAADAAPGDKWDVLRRRLAWLGVPLGIAVAMYTGILLGAMPARPFWNSPILAMLFLVSSLSTGVAGILLLQALFGDGKEEEPKQAESSYLLAASDVMLIGLELLVIFLFILFAHLTVGNVKEAVSVILSGGSLATLFWFGVVIIGLLLPVLVELKYVIPKLLYQREYAAPRGVELLVPVFILIGGFLLRYVVVMAGQITGPVGI